jgi:hypothetical protein
MWRRSLIGGVVALAFVGSACAVDATVTVRVDADGSGVVRVDVVADPEAVQTAEVGGGTIEDRVRLADLAETGWTVDPWVRNLDGSASLRLRKPFTSVDQVAGVLRELNGDAGPLRGAAFDRRRSFLETEYSATATVDLGAMSTGITSDSELVARLQAQGVDVAGVDQQLLVQLRDALTVRLVVDLPGPGTVVVEPEPGQPASLDASTSVRDSRRVVLLASAGLLLLAAMITVVWPRRRTPRPPGPHHLPEAPHSSYRRRPEPREPLSYDEATSRRTPRAS